MNRKNRKSRSTANRKNRFEPGKFRVYAIKTVVVLTPKGFLRGKAAKVKKQRFCVRRVCAAGRFADEMLAFPGRSLKLIGSAGVLFLRRKGSEAMETRVAVISIIVEDRQAAEAINRLLHQFGQWIIGRMGLPYNQKNISIISVAVDGPQDQISALSGKLGALPGVSTKTIYSKV